MGSSHNDPSDGVNLAARRESADLSRGRLGRAGRFAATVVVLAMLAACAGATPTAAPATQAPATQAPATQAPATAPSDTPKMGNGKKQLAWAIGLHDLSVIQDIDKLMTDRAKSRGWEMFFDQGTAGNIQPMIASVQSWITQGVPAMCVTSDDPSAMAPLQKQALEKGLIWTVYGTQDMPTNPHAFIGFPATEAGAKGADETVKYINESNPNAEVLLLTQVTNPGGKPREELPRAAIESRTKATIVGYQDGGDQLKGLQATQTALTAHPNLSVVVSRTDAGALGAAQAFKQAGIPPEKVFILTYDGSLESLKELKDENYIKVIIALDLEKLANAVVDTTIDLALSGPPAQHIDAIVATDIVDRNSPKLDQLIAFYEARQ